MKSLYKNNVYINLINKLIYNCNNKIILKFCYKQHKKIIKNNITILQLFYRFLKSHNAYHKFIHNILNKQESIYLFYHLSNISTMWSDRLLNNAFLWEYTKEGKEYWHSLNRKWIDLIVHLNISNYRANNKVY